MCLLENTDDSRFGLVEDDIVDLVVAMNESSSVLRLCLLLRKERHHFVKVWDLSHCFLGFNVDSLGLVFGQRLEKAKLPVVEARWFAESREVHRGGIDTMELG